MKSAEALLQFFSRWPVEARIEFAVKLSDFAEELMTLPPAHTDEQQQADEIARLWEELGDLPKGEKNLAIMARLKLPKSTYFRRKKLASLTSSTK